MNDSAIIQECYSKALEKLIANCNHFGLMAAGAANHESKHKFYTSLFARDIGVSSIGILSSGNEKLIATLKQSLEYLAVAQTERGQIPFFYAPEENRVKWWNPGCIDSTLWWCIASLLYVKHTHDHDFYSAHKDHIEKGYQWLLYQDTNNDLLLEQGEASDWADEMPRQGSVLYTNALWYWLIKLRIEVEKREDLHQLREDVYIAFNTLFWVHKETSENVSYIPDNSFTRNNRFAKTLLEIINSQVQFLPYYLGYVTHKKYEMRCDVTGNILANLVGLADEKKSSLFIDFILRAGVNKPYPIKVLYPPIYPGEQDYYTYMSKGRQNFPWQYHNGGIWPFVGGFWIMLLSHRDKTLAREELVKVAEANSLNDFEFNEYLHGQHGTPMGIPNQSWNMAMFLACFNSVTHSHSLL